MSGEGAAAGGLKGILSSGAAKAAGGKIASGLGSAAGGIGQTAGAAGSAVKGAAAATGWFGAKSAFEAGQDKGFWLFLGGLFYYFLKVIGVPVTLLVILATFLLVLSGLVLFEGKKGGWITLIIFYIWGIIFGFKGVYPPDPNFLMYVSSIILVILLGYGIFTKGKGFGDEAIGFLPIVIFFLDIGLFSKIIGSYATITSLLTTMILYMPWFAFLGLFNTKKSNILINVAKFVGVFYLVSLVSIGLIPELGFSSEEIFNPEEYLSAEQDVRSEFGGGPNPAWLQLTCTFGMFTNVGSIESYSVEECVAEKRLAYELDYRCRTDYGYEKGTSSYERCLRDEKERMEEQSIIQGSVDSSIVELTKAEFVIDRNTFPSKIIRRTGQTMQYPFQLNIENPREQEIELHLSCDFSKKEGKLETIIEGEIIPEGGEVVIISDKIESVSRICNPKEELNGTYNLNYTVQLKGLETISYLTRLFVDEYNEGDDLIKDAKNEYLSRSSSYSSSPNEFARINFAFGEPETNPIIETNDNILLSSSIENLQNGRITNINNYQIMVESDFHATDGDYGCLLGDSSYIYLPLRMRKGENIPVSVCFLSMSEDLKSDLNGIDFELRTYKASLSYDYEIQKETNIEVELIGDRTT